jgi:hypothetical protein
MFKRTGQGSSKGLAIVALLLGMGTAAHAGDERADRLDRILLR